MTAGSYRPALSMVLAHEGGFVDHPKDPGGPTNQGITQRVYDAYRKLRGYAVQSVKYITALEVEEIYNKQYWQLVRGDMLPAGLDYAVFDFAVNSGVSRAVRYLQRLVEVDDDGALGNETLLATYELAKANEEELVIRYCANRMAFLKSLGTFPTFGKGWTRRVMGKVYGFQATDVGVIDAAVMMARQDAAFEMPSSIGSQEGETPAKAIAPAADRNVFPMATPADLEALAAQNDMLAGIILTGKLP